MYQKNDQNRFCINYFRTIHTTKKNIQITTTLNRKKKTRITKKNKKKSKKKNTYNKKKHLFVNDVLRNILTTSNFMNMYVRNMQNAKNLFQLRSHYLFRLFHLFLHFRY